MPTDAVRPSVRAKVSYGLGDFAFGMSWNMVGAFLLVFYTDVARLPAVAVGTLFLLSRLLDAVVDPVVGLLVDRTRSRWGRARPYFLFGAIPFAVLCVLTFWSPPWSEGARLAWAIITFGLLGLLFSVVNIPYSALLPMMTDRPKDRVQLSSLRSAGTSISVILVTAATMPLVGWFGGADRAHGFLVVSALYAAVTAALVLNLFVSCRETVRVDADASRGPVLPEIGRMVRNRAWLVVFLFTTLNFIRFGAVLSVTVYFAVNVLRQPWMIGLLLPAVSGTLLIGSLIAPPYLRRLGMRTGNLAALALAVILYAGLPLLEDRPAAFLAVYVLASISLSLTMTAIFAMAAEAVDYHEALFGERNEGLLSSGISLATKIGMALGSALIAYGLAIGGYDAAAVTPRAAGMIRGLYYAPAIAIMMMQMLCIHFYPSVSSRTRGAPVA